MGRRNYEPSELAQQGKTWSKTAEFRHLRLPRKVRRRRGCSPDGVRPSRYGVAVRHHVSVAGPAPHPELTPLRTRFLCSDETARLTPALQQMMIAFADAAPFDMGRLDVRARSLELLLTEPHRMQVLEVNIGFAAADFHVTDLRHPLAVRLRMTIDKWEYAIQLGAGDYEAAPRRIGFFGALAECLRQAVILGSMHRDMYRPKTR